MSRGIRDLRELICVSRLTIRDSDEDDAPGSPSDFDDRISRALDELSTSSIPDVDGRLSRTFESLRLKNDDRDGSASSIHSLPRTIPTVDSGFNTNGISPEIEVATEIPHSETKSKRRKRNKKKGSTVLPRQFEWPKPALLPPVMAGSSSRPTSSACSMSSSTAEVERVGVKAGTRRGICDPESGHFDGMLSYMDATIVSQWLTRANAMVHELAGWCLEGENFVQFAHFWLRDFPDVQKKDIIELERGIVLDELCLAFAVGRESRKVNQADIVHLIDALFREYPAKMLSTKGPHMFLDYLDIFTSERQKEYKKVLSDVKVSTRNRQYAEWLLATRSFILVNMWTSVVNFYRNLTVLQHTGTGLPAPQRWDSKSNVHHLRTSQAIRNGYVEVLHYLLRTGKIDSDFKDDHKKTLVFHCVVQKQVKILKYLLNQVKPYPDVSSPAENGNTPLHTAASNGHSDIVQLLLDTNKVDIDVTNPECDDATPLHLAVMQGQQPVVDVLLNCGADHTRLMGGLTSKDLARDFGHYGILNLFDDKGL